MSASLIATDIVNVFVLTISAKLEPVEPVEVDRVELEHAELAHESRDAGRARWPRRPGPVEALRGQRDSPGTGQAQLGGDGGSDGAHDRMHLSAAPRGGVLAASERVLQICRPRLPPAP